MPVSNRPWSDVPESAYPDASAFCSACLIDLNPSGKPKSKALCKLPVREPGGALNRNAVHAAAGALSGARGGVQAPKAERQAAARKLIRLYGELNEDPPPAVKALA